MIEIMKKFYFFLGKTPLKVSFGARKYNLGIGYSQNIHTFLIP